MSISFSGLASGLDTTSWIKSLTALKQAKVTSLEKQKSGIQALQSSLGSIKTFFSNFRTSLEKITDTKFNIASMDIFSQCIANTTNARVLTAVASANAKEGNYDIEVKRLATKTKASSRASYTKTITESSNASENTKLADLGITSGSIMFTFIDGTDSGEITVDENMTLKDFAAALRENGIDAYYSEWSGLFTTDLKDVENIGQKNPTNVLEKLGITLDGTSAGYYSKKSLQLEQIVNRTADTDTTLAALNVTDGTIKIQNCSDNSTFTIDIDADNFTLGNFIQSLNDNGIYASLNDDGVLSISNANIVEADTTTNLASALGLTRTVASNSAQTGKLTYNVTNSTTVQAKGTTLLSELGIEFTEGKKQAWVRANDGTETLLNIYEDSDINHVVSELNNAGLVASFDNDTGKLTISGGEIIGRSTDTDSPLYISDKVFFDINSIFGLSPTRNTAVSSKTLTQIATSTPVTASTKLGDIGISGTQDLIIENADGSQTTLTIDNIENITISTLRTKISQKGISSVLNADGSLTFTNTTKKIVGGSLAEALGITTETYSVESSNQLKYNVVSTATTSSQLQYLGISGTNNITITKADGTELSQDFAQGANLQSVLNFLNTSGSGVTASFNNGVISITSNGSVVEGALASALEIDTEYQTIQLRKAQTSKVIKNPNSIATSTTKLGDVFGTDLELNVSFDNLYTSVLSAVTVANGTMADVFSTEDFYIGKEIYLNTDAGSLRTKKLGEATNGDIDKFIELLIKQALPQYDIYIDSSEFKDYLGQYATNNSVSSIEELTVNQTYIALSNYVGERINQIDLSKLRTTIDVCGAVLHDPGLTLADFNYELRNRFGITFAMDGSTGKITVSGGPNMINGISGSINEQLDLSRKSSSTVALQDFGVTSSQSLNDLGLSKGDIITLAVNEEGETVQKKYELFDLDKTIYEQLQEQGANVTISNGNVCFDGESIIGGTFVKDKYGSEDYFKYNGYSSLNYTTESVAQGLKANLDDLLADIGLTSTLKITLSNGDIISLDPINANPTIRTLCDKSQGLFDYNAETGRITLNQNNFMYISSADTDFLSNLGIDINAIDTTKILTNKRTSTSSSALKASVNGSTGLSDIVGTSGNFNLAINIDSVMTGIIHALSDVIGIDSATNPIDDFYSKGYYRDTIAYLKNYFRDDYDYLGHAIGDVFEDIGLSYEDFFTALKKDNWLSSCYSFNKFDDAISNGLEALGLSDKKQLTFRQLYGVLFSEFASIDGTDPSKLKQQIEFVVPPQGDVDWFCSYINDQFGLEASFDTEFKLILFSKTYNTVSASVTGSDNYNSSSKMNIDNSFIDFGTNFDSQITNTTTMANLGLGDDYNIKAYKFDNNGVVIGTETFTISASSTKSIMQQMQDQGYNSSYLVYGGTLLDKINGKYYNTQFINSTEILCSTSCYTTQFLQDVDLNTSHTLSEIGVVGSGSLDVITNNGNTSTTVNYDENMTVGEFLNRIDAVSSGMVGLSSDGILTVNASANRYIANDSNNIMQDIFKINPTTSEVSNSLVSTVPTVVSGTTKLSDLPNYEYGTWEITNSETGTTSTIRFGSDKTVNEIIGDLQEAGIDAKLSSGIFNLSYAPSITINKNGIDPLSLTKNSTKLVGTSNRLVINTYQNADVSTKLVDLKDENGASFDFNGKTITLTKNDGTSVVKNLSGEQNLNEILNWFSQNGINAYLTDSGKIQFETNAPFTLSDNSSNQVCDFLFGNISNSTTYNQVNPLEYVEELTNTVEMTNNTKMSDLGITAGEFYIFNNGVRNVIDVSEDMTIGEFRNILSSFSGGNLYTSLNNGNLVLNGMGNSYIAKSENANATNLVDKLFPDGFSQSYNYTSNALNEDVITYLAPTGSTLISNYDEPNKPSAGILNLKIGTGGSVQYKSIEITADDTFDSLTEKFKQIGLDARLVDGVYRLNTDADITQRVSTSNLFSNLELDQNPYSNKKVTIQTTRTETVEGSAAESVGMDTKLNVLGITNGKFIIENRGNAITVDVSADDTFNDLNEKIKTASSDKLSLTIDNGIIKIASSNTNDSLNTRITGASSNIISICGFSPDSNGALVSSRPLYKVNGDSVLTNAGMFRNGTVTTGTFTIGDAELTVSNDTTINDLIRMINQNENALCTAYWDSTSGQLVLSSRVAGSSMINIEKGTSNITDILGFTVNNTIVDNAQELGQNALFTINGTTMTHTSNTITSDISKIDGVTINLNDASDGEIITLSIERDNESIANTLQEVVDSYNDLMNNLDKELALDGSMKDQTTLKMLRNTIRSYMMNSVGFSNTFMNMSSIGISTDSASAGNISTSGISTLSFDKTKFANAIAADPNSVKKLLVGENNGMGVLTKLEQTVENALQAQSGFFSATENSYNKQIERLNTKIEKTQRSVDSYSARLERKFQAMDLLISNIQKQYSSFLSA